MPLIRDRMCWCRLALAGLVVWAEATVAQEAPVVPIAEVNRILSDPSRTEARELTFRGVVIFVSRAGDICLQGVTDGVMIEPPTSAERQAVGDEIEVVAGVKFQTIDATDPDLVLRASAVRRLGAGRLPEPERPWLVEALNGKSNRRWVEVEGVVMQAMLERGVVLLHVTDTSGWAVVSVHDWRSQSSLRDWWGARIKVRCANIGRGHRALRVASSDQITVIKPGTAELFGAPLADATALRRSGGATADRKRLAATVLAVQDGFVYLRSPAGALRASLLVPYASSESTPHPLELIPPAVPSLQVGDRVELVGSPLRIDPWLELSFASFRLLGHGEPPEAAPVTGATLGTNGLCDRVRVTGTVRGHAQKPGGRGLVESLAMDADGTAFDAVLESERGGQLALHHEGDVLDMTGVVIPPEAGRPPSLHLAGLQEIGAPDLAVVKRSLPPVVIRTIGLLAGGLALALAGAWWLQRQVRLRTTALAVANDALRTEVAVRERTQAELARALAQEREVGELKSRFVTMVSHEFRTPLGITMSAIELLRHHSDKLDDEQRAQLFDDIHRSTRGMGGLMEQVLVLGRVEAGSVGCRPVPLSLDGLAQKLTDESLSATNRRSPIHWRSDGDLSGAQADETLLRHIFSNLLSNAVKYSPENSPVEFSCRRQGGEAVFEVADRGLGIPETDRPRLYEAFHRCANVTDIPGTGLGLVIVKRCVDLHGGTIDFTSTVNGGTTFTVRLPLFPANAEAGTPPS